MRDGTEMDGNPRRRLRTIALVTGAELALFNMALARELKRRTGCRVVLYVSGPESVRSHEKFRRDGAVDEIVDRNRLLPACAETVLDEDSVFARARAMENLIGCSYNEVMMARRDIGRGFALGGFYHPRFPMVDRLSYAQIVHGVTESLDFWKGEIETKGLDLVINGQKDAIVIARALGVPSRILYSSRVQNFYFWARDEFCGFFGLKEAYEHLADRDFAPVVLTTPYLQEIKHRALNLEGSLVWKVIKRMLVLAQRRIYLTIKGYRSSWDYSTLSTLHFYLRNYLGLRHLRHPRTCSLSSIKGRKFVFLPLQTEPEMSLQSMSPEYFCQIGMVGSLARDLPAGVILAVKDTIHGVGRRPRDFYDQIREFKNVVLLDVTEQGIEVIRHAAAVATITGTAGLEGAMMGKPVILFGRHTGYGFLPHVQLIGREEDLRTALMRALDGSMDQLQAVRDGARLREALISISFDMRNYTNVDLKSFDEPTVNNAVGALLKSLEQPESAVAAAG